MILCAGNAYEKKYYLNPEFEQLPEQIKKELQVMTVLFLEDVGGILTLEFNDEGDLELKTQAADSDLLYDEINAGLQIRRLQKEKKELFESLELYYKVFGAGSADDLESVLTELERSGKGEEVERLLKELEMPAEEDESEEFPEDFEEGGQELDDLDKLIGELEKAGDEVDIEKLLAEIEEAENYSKMRDFMRELDDIDPDDEEY